MAGDRDLITRLEHPFAAPGVARLKPVVHDLAVNRVFPPFEQGRTKTRQIGRRAFSNAQFKLQHAVITARRAQPLHVIKHGGRLREAHPNQAHFQ